MKALLLSSLLLAAQTSPAQRPLDIRGRVHGPSREAALCTITLLTRCGDTLLIDQPRSGRFHYRVQREASYLVQFAQDGSITKEVVVDAAQLPRTRNAFRVRAIEFDVVMKQGDPNQRWRYDSPVGFITFRRGSGSMQVLYDHDVEPVAATP